MEIFSYIRRYINHLKDNENLSVSLHPLFSEKVIADSRLITFNVHSNPYCIFLKSIGNTLRHCKEHQKKVLEKLKAENSFCGTCYAGVKEYIYPLIANDNIIGFISVSGYKDQNSYSYLLRTAEKHCISSSLLSDTYSLLQDEIPDKSYVDKLIFPLVYMLELAYKKVDSLKSNSILQINSKESVLFEDIINYIHTHYHEKIQIDDICQQFFCCRSKISHMFKKNTNKSFPQYITELRIKDAKHLLLHSNLSVYDIAIAIGYSERNYFSNVFYRETGCYPLEYRKKHKKK